MEPQLGIFVVNVFDLIDHDVLKEGRQPFGVAVAQVSGELFKLGKTPEEVEHLLHVKGIAIVEPISHLNEVYQFSYGRLVIRIFLDGPLVVPHLMKLLGMIWKYGLLFRFVPGSLVAISSLVPDCGP